MSETKNKAAKARRTSAAASSIAPGDRPGLDQRLFVNSIEKGMTILELFETSNHDLSLTDIIARTEMGRSATQRFVYSLHQLGYLSRDPDTRRYALGPKVLSLYRGFLGGRSVMQRAQRALRDLNLATRECTAWAELLDHDIVIVDSLPSPHVTSVNLSAGMRFEALSSSSGQVLLAYARPQIAEAAFAAASDAARQRAGVKDAAGLHRLLSQIRAQGFALTEKAFDQESLSISAPVFDVQHRAVGAINLSTVRGRFDRREALAQLAPQVVAAAQAGSQTK